jgi:hypothetical protein
MKRFFAAAFACALFSLLAAAQDDLPPMHEHLQFLVGQWNTVSAFPATGQEVPGVLTYRWVLGGAWLHVEFKGDHPERPVWEAYAMMRWDPQADCYVSWAFFGPGEPLRYTGKRLENGTISMETERDGRRYGIDYTPVEGGTVYQENWAVDESGTRTVTLKTTYTPRPE